MSDADILFSIMIAKSSARRSHNVVDDEDYRISDQPIYTNDVEDCNVVVLLGTPFCAMVHRYWEYGSISRDHPLVYLPPIITKLKERGVENLTAALVAGDHNHQKALEELLGEAKIPIVAKYCDGVYPIDTGNPNWEDNPKELALIPQTHQLLINSRLSGLRQLYPPIE